MPSTLLHIDASARHAGSVSRELSARVVDRLSADSVIRRDLSDPLPLITESWVQANLTPEPERDAVQRDTLALSDSLVDELERADTIVIGLPIYNFSVPAALKAWIDLVARAGRTFRYTAEGPEGLLTGKRAVLVVASGGTGVGSEIDFATNYLRFILGFMGIGTVEIVAADRLMIDADASRAAANDAVDRIAA